MPSLMNLSPASGSKSKYFQGKDREDLFLFGRSIKNSHQTIDFDMSVCKAFKIFYNHFLNSSR